MGRTSRCRTESRYIKVGGRLFFPRDGWKLHKKQIRYTAKKLVDAGITDNYTTGYFELDKNEDKSWNVWFNGTLVIQNYRGSKI